MTSMGIALVTAEHLQADCKDLKRSAGGQDCDGMVALKLPIKPRSADRQALPEKPTGQCDDTQGQSLGRSPGSPGSTDTLTVVSVFGEPVDGRTPASLQRAPEATDVYCEPQTPFCLSRGNFA